MIQLREANARSSVSLIAPAHPPCRAPGAPDASDANRSRSRSDRLFTHTPPKTRDLARKIFSPKKSHLYGKSLSWRSSRARRRASSRAHLSVRGVPVQANPALIVCASARARALVSLIELANARRVDATRQSIERIARFFPAPSPRGAVVASFAFAFAFARAASASPISSSARVASFARARSFDRRTRPPIASTSADAPARRSRREESLASRPGMPSQP